MNNKAMKTAEEFYVEKHGVLKTKCTNFAINFAEQYASQFKPKWISAKDAMPTSEDANDNGRVLIRAYWRDADGSINGLTDVMCWEDVPKQAINIFWMPLPEAPNK